MLASVRTRKDDTMEELLFVSREAAESFLSFVEMYKNESGAGNGYGAYWVYDDNLEMTDGCSDRFTGTLDLERVIKMAWDIAYARSGGSPVTLPSITYYEGEEGAIGFAFWGFDSRVVPAAGDMYRVVDWQKLSAEEGPYPKEGRVLSIMGENATILGWYDEDENGRAKENAAPLVVPLDAIMKIPDWLKKSRERKRGVVQ